LTYYINGTALLALAPLAERRRLTAPAERFVGFGVGEYDDCCFHGRSRGACVCADARPSRGPRCGSTSVAVAWLTGHPLRVAITTSQRSSHSAASARSWSWRSPCSRSAETGSARDVDLTSTRRQRGASFGL
jgi:hypothetical protein